MLEKRSASKAPDAQIVIDQTRVIQASDFTWRRGLDTDRTASVGFSRAAHSLHFALQYLPCRGAVEDTAEMSDPCAPEIMLAKHPPAARISRHCPPCH